MASTINADNGVSSGSAGLKSTADSSGVLALQTNGTTAISIDASQAVSFTNQPTYSGGTANGVAYLNGSKVLTTGSALVFDGANLGVGTASPNIGGLTRALTLNTPTGGNYSGVELAGAGTLSARFITNNVGTYFGSQLSIPLVFETNGSERARFNAGAPIFCLSGGNTSATGTGITFPATQSASTDANTLDDYEEGTWTPTFSVGGTTFTSRGWYIKVGVVCHIGFNNLEGVSAISDGATAIVTGLPFNIKQDSGTSNYKFGAGIACIFSDASDGYNNKPLAGRINPANPVGGQASAAKIDFRNISGVATTTADPFSFGGSYITE